VQRSIECPDTCIVDQDVTTLVTRPNLLHKRLHRGKLPDVTLDRRTTPPVLADSGCGGFQLSKIATRDDYLGAEAGEGTRDGSADSVPAAGNDGDLFAKPTLACWHVFSLAELDVRQWSYTSRIPVISI
jgi:hypothetical protein